MLEEQLTPEQPNGPLMVDASNLSEFQTKVIQRVAAADDTMPCLFGVHVGQGLEIQARIGDTDGDAGPLARILTGIILYLEENSDHEAEEFIELIEDYIQQYREDDTAYIMSRDLDEG